MRHVFKFCYNNNNADKVIQYVVDVEGNPWLMGNVVASNFGYVDTDQVRKHVVNDCKPPLHNNIATAGDRSYVPMRAPQI